MVKSYNPATKGRKEVSVSRSCNVFFEAESGLEVQRYRGWSISDFWRRQTYFCTGEISLFIDTNDNDKINNKNIHLVNIYYLQGSVLNIVYVATYLILKTTL